ncbi:hypothetical protein SporoP8_10925 [Sporosarcina ureae]|uniref:thiol-disulfide oxidoreductase DCC family protein n=1 Tax=Sporosarcina ureae TaxID=1571 RepID=UPI000A15580D|nr:hypothetical protein SporoP8_10925 [Sporosarcina ureae]
MKSQNLVIYYDSFCPLCTKTKNRWSKMDRKNLLIFHSFRDINVLKSIPIPLDLLEKEIYSKELFGNKYYSGVDTFIEMNRRIPLLKFTVPILVILKKLGLANKCYTYVANKRKIIPIGQCDAEKCNILSRK